MSAYECPRCAERIKDWNGSDPKCAFAADGSFVTENWNCATMNGLRELCGDDWHGRAASFWHEDMNVGVIGAPDDPDGSHGGFLILRWYKHRGRTEEAYDWPLSGAPTPLTLERAERVLELAT